MNKFVNELAKTFNLNLYRSFFVKENSNTYRLTNSGIQRLVVENNGHILSWLNDNIVDDIKTGKLTIKR